MTVVALVVIAVLTIVALVLVFLDGVGYQQARQWLEGQRGVFDAQGHVTDEALEAFVADEMLHEAEGDR